MDTNFNLNQLRVFHSVATLMSFTRAAEKLHLTQPGISKHIKDLEEHYGNKLFNRLGKKVALTQAGEVLFEAVTKMFRLLDEANRKINDLKGLVGGTLSVGASVMIGTYILPRVLARFRKRHPSVDIALDISLSEHIVDKVLDNTLEVGLIGHRASDSKLIVQQFKADRMVLIVPVDHGWAKRRAPVSLRDLIDQPFLLPQKGSGTRRILENLFDRSGTRPRHIMELGNSEGVKKAVEAGLGISIISQHIVQNELATHQIRSLSLKGADLRRDLYVVYLKNRYLSAAAQAFLKDLDKGT
jgi:DNA-binding transcriptional LysR family regulator